MDPEIFRTTVPAHPRNLKLIRDFIHDVAGQRLGEAADMVVLAVDESCSNVLRHQPEPEGRDLTVEVAIDAESVRFSIRNFCCTDDLPKIKPRKLKEVRPGGLGTHFVGEIMDRLDYLPDPERPGRMMLVLEKKLPPEERGG